MADQVAPAHIAIGTPDRIVDGRPSAVDVVLPNGQIVATLGKDGLAQLVNDRQAAIALVYTTIGAIVNDLKNYFPPAPQSQWNPGAAGLGRGAAAGLQPRRKGGQSQARQPAAAQVGAQNWNAWQCDAAGCHQVAGNRKYLVLAPILNGAGWYQDVPSAPVSISKPGSWARWRNVTGRVAGLTTFADELGSLFQAPEIATSSLRDRLSWRWNGTDFTATGA